MKIYLHLLFSDVCNWKLPTPHIGQYFLWRGGL